MFPPYVHPGMYTPVYTPLYTPGYTTVPLPSVAPTSVSGLSEGERALGSDWEIPLGEEQLCADISPSCYDR